MSEYHNQQRLKLLVQNAAKFNDYANIKDLILSELINAVGKFNSSILRRDYFKKSKASSEIIEKTNFLDPTTTMQHRLYCIVNDITTHPMCVVCDKFATMSPHHGKGFSATCGSPKCKSNESLDKRMSTRKTRYGGNGVSPLQLQRTIERVPDFIRKGSEALLINHSVTNPSQIPGHSDKVKNTLMERYGVTSSAEIKSNINKRNKQRFDTVSNLLDGSSGNVTLVDIVQDSTRLESRKCTNVPYNVSFDCNECNSHTETLTHETIKWRVNNASSVCSVCSNLNVGSLLETELYDYIVSLLPGVNIVRNTRQLISPYEIDILIPSLNIAFEFDGIYWHSVGIDSDDRITSRYHLTKTDSCKEIGVQLIHIFESEWVNKQSKVKSRIKTLLKMVDVKIGARKCEVVSLTSKEAGVYVNEWHLQGKRTGPCNLALRYDDITVAVMTFGKPRFSKGYEWELLRFCVKPGISVTGGASKLYKHFIKTQNPQSVVTYADKRWSVGKLYDILGFKWLHNSPPNYFYWHELDGSLELHTRVKFQKHKLRDKLDVFDETISETLNMFNNGYRKIWDCGNSVWCWNRD